DTAARERLLDAPTEACAEDRWTPLAARGGARHARPASPAASKDADGAGGRAPQRAQGDRASEPPRLVELPVVQAVRHSLDVPQLRRRARAAPRPRRRLRGICGV